MVVLLQQHKHHGARQRGFAAGSILVFCLIQQLRQSRWLVMFDSTDDGMNHQPTTTTSFFADQPAAGNNTTISSSTSTSTGLATDIVVADNPTRLSDQASNNNNNDGENDSTDVEGKSEGTDDDDDDEGKNTNNNNELKKKLMMNNNKRRRGTRTGRGRGRNNQNDNGYVSSILLPRPMELLRNGMSLEQFYELPQLQPQIQDKAGNKYKKQKRKSNQCSCTSTTVVEDFNNNKKKCCRRILQRDHKMGFRMTMDIFGDGYTTMQEMKRKGQIELSTGDLTLRGKLWDLLLFGDSSSSSPDKKQQQQDYRAIIMLRNIYDSLVSGYLYHLSGRECWLTSYGEVVDETKGSRRGKLNNPTWSQQVSFESYMYPPPHASGSLCQYLNDASEEMGMRTYIDYVFRDRYSGIFNHWAIREGMSNASSTIISDRTHVVCYEDLNNATLTNSTINRMLNFWYNGSAPMVKSWWEKYNKRMLLADSSSSNNSNDGASHDPASSVGRRMSQKQNATTTIKKDKVAGHTIAKDPKTIERLLKLIQRIDETYYNGDIAWVNSVLPC